MNTKPTAHSVPKRVHSAGSDVSDLCVACRRTLTKKIYSQDGNDVLGEGGDEKTVHGASPQIRSESL